MAMQAAAPADWLAEYPPPRSLPLDQEATRVCERAYHLGLPTEGTGLPPVTFTTVPLRIPRLPPPGPSTA